MNKRLIDKLEQKQSLSLEEYERLIATYTPEDYEYIRSKAEYIRQSVYGKDIYIRGLIEISNICKNDCYYCGIRKSNANCDRYRLSEIDILACVQKGYALGFRTFVLQGGEDGYFTDDRLCMIIKSIKSIDQDLAVTLSVGERSYESYKKLFDAGADRYLLRHETADEDHYNTLHPEDMSYKNRMQCLKNLRKIGYQVGCGFMVSSPGQSYQHLSKDLKFIEKFKPDMCGIGPFIPHRDTKYAEEKAGTVEFTCMLLAIIRLIHPKILLPATTALGTISSSGREQGILSGANVVMPNLSPASVREKYLLYDNKLSSGAEAAQNKALLEEKMASIGYQIVCSRGDVIK